MSPIITREPQIMCVAGEPGRTKTRKHFLMSLLWLACLAGHAPLQASNTQESAGPKQPNILILYADDLGYGDLRSYNPESKIPTPHLDRLAKTGMVFTDGHSSSGICTPSRYALHTGRYHWRKFHNIVTIFGESKFDDEELTLPEVLKQRGYSTALIGKWHLGWNWEAILHPDAEPVGMRHKQKVWDQDAFDWSQPIPDGPLAHGYDHYFGDTVINFPPYTWIEDDRVTKAPTKMLNMEDYSWVKEGRMEMRPGPVVEGWDPYENIPLTTQKGVEFIHKQSHNPQPFFLFFSFPSPHAPIIPNDAFDGTSQAGPYGDFVVETDDACGKLLAALEASGQAENTIVVFTADNGPEHYAYERDAKFDHWSAYPLRGLKRDIYEGGHRVPFIVRWPHVIAEGSRSHALISQIDLMATIAAIVGFDIPEDQAFDSIDQSAVWKGQPETPRTQHVHNTWENRWALREGPWVLIEGNNGYHSRKTDEWLEKYTYPADDDGPHELYHLGYDLGQRFNLADAYPERVKHMRAALEAIKKSPQ
jgi:arylsulfatase A